MERKRIDEIENCAQNVVGDIEDGAFVDPYTIAGDNGIKVVQGNYGHYFKGLIQYISGKYCISLNLDILQNIEFPRSRYTCSHELGHRFIKSHRDRLKKGESLSFREGHVTNPEIKQIEKEAEFFAACLLMPKDEFYRRYDEVDKSFGGIIDLKVSFNVSLTSAAIRYATLVSDPLLLVLWNEKGIVSKGATSSMKELITDNSLVIYNPDRPISDLTKHVHQVTNIRYQSLITNLSGWVKGSPKELQYLSVQEETMFSSYFNISMIRPLDYF